MKLITSYIQLTIDKIINENYIKYDNIQHSETKSTYYVASDR